TPLPGTLEPRKGAVQTTPDVVPATGLGPGPRELITIAGLWLLAALAPWIGWRLLSRIRRR
ncbi:MAG: hypothetical protein HW378_3684, partial [Anaerolineales bacterium]|nr:hypothetical protein [Anaerolineales bacterium]